MNHGVDDDFKPCVVRDQPDLDELPIDAQRTARRQQLSDRSASTTEHVGDRPVNAPIVEQLLTGARATLATAIAEYPYGRLGEPSLGFLAEQQDRGGSQIGLRYCEPASDEKPAGVRMPQCRGIVVEKLPVEVPQLGTGRFGRRRAGSASGRSSRSPLAAKQTTACSLRQRSRADHPTVR